MAKTFLSGPEPDREKEKRTEAQINDDRLPSSMSRSRSLSDFAEDDETPAIEQATKFRSQEQQILHANSKPSFKIDQDLEQRVKDELAKKAEKRKRKFEKEQKAKEEVKQKALEAEKHAKELANNGLAEIDGALVPLEAVKDKKPEVSKYEELYPTPKPQYDEDEEKIFRKNLETEETFPERAVVAEEYDLDMKKRIIVSFINQGVLILSLLFLLVYQIKNPFDELVQMLITAVTVILWVFSFKNLLRKEGKYKFSKVQHSLQLAYALATIIPGYYLKVGTITLFQALNFIPGMAGQAANIFMLLAGLFFGAGLHFDLIRRLTSPKYVSYIQAADIIGTMVFITVATIIPELIKGNILNAASGFIIMAMAFIIVVTVERYAAKLSK